MIKYLIIFVVSMVSLVQCADNDALLITAMGRFLQLPRPSYYINHNDEHDENYENDENYIYLIYYPWPHFHVYRLCSSTSDDAVNLAYEVPMGLLESKNLRCDKPPKSSIKNLSDSLNEAKVKVEYEIGFNFKTIPLPDTIAKPTQTDASIILMEPIMGEDHATVEDKFFKTPITDPSTSANKNEGNSTNNDIQFMKVISVMINRKNGSKTVNYSTMQRFIKPPNKKKIEEIRFNPDKEVYGDIDLDALYEKKRLSNSELYLIKQQLASADHFELDTLKKATYHDSNTAPIWNIYVEKWRNIMTQVRKVARNLPKAYIATGVVPMRNNSDQVYLDEDTKKIQVPYMFWTALTNHTGDETIGTEAILIVLFNDPNMKEHDKLCEDICEANGWLNISNTDSTSEFAYCCEFNLKNAEALNITISNIISSQTIRPLNLKATSILTHYIDHIFFLNPINIQDKLELENPL